MTTQKPAAMGTTYNLKTQGPDGKLTTSGRVFIASDGSGGTVYVGEGETERKYKLFPRDFKPRAKAQRPVASSQPAAQVGL
jgi:hypothetical protein